MMPSTMIRKLRKAMREISAQKGEFTLFGVFMRPDALGAWDLVVSAPWLEEGKLKALGEFTKLLSKSIGEQSLQNFSRIVTVNRDSSALNSILASMSVDDGELRRVKQSQFFGLDIEDAIILRAKRAA
jgi:hypothetical protein